MNTASDTGDARTELVRLLVAVRGARSQTQAAHESGLSQSKISRAERDRFPLTPAEAKLYAARLDATAEQTDRLVALTTERITNQATGRVALVRVAASIQERLARVQREATLVRSWQVSMVPGVLQTPEYTAALVAGDDVGELGPDWWAARRSRVDALREPGRSWEILISEAALRWTLGSAALMAEQVRHIGAMSQLPHVRIGVVALATPKTFAAPRTFHLYDDRTVTVATDVGTSFVRDPGDIEHFEHLFAQLDGVALHGDDARALLARIAAEHTG